jgi:hypothetical protein
MKNSNDTIGNRTRDLPAGSAVPQPTAPLRAPPIFPKASIMSIMKIYFLFSNYILSQRFLLCFGVITVDLFFCLYRKSPCLFPQFVICTLYNFPLKKSDSRRVYVVI